MSTSFESRWVDVDRIPVHYMAAENDDAAPPVVLVHGLGLSHRYLMPTGERLARSFRVYIPDLPGFGLSGDPSEILDMAGLADALAAWMLESGVGRASLLGNSLACQIMVELAVRHPDLVERAVMQGPTTPPEERTWFWQFVRWRQNDNPKSMQPTVRRDYEEAGYRRILATFNSSLKHRLEEKLHAIEAPTLIVRGSRDPICNQNWAEEFTRLLPNGRLIVIPGVQHTLVYVNPLELVRVSEPFLLGEEPGEDARGWLPRDDEEPPSTLDYLASFDSSSAFVRSLSNFSHGKDFPLLDVFPPVLEKPWRLLGKLVNSIPSSLRRQIYIWSGRGSAITSENLSRVRANDLGRWVTGRYPRTRVPAVAIGSSNGALVHLCAALGIPWLPQTFLVPVGHGKRHPDAAAEEMEWSREPGRRLLSVNPELELHQMHDPNQDRLMVRRMTYFRVKMRRLVDSYLQFIEDSLEENGTLLVVDCRLEWPAIRLDDRHHFQLGAYGGARTDEYLGGGERVRQMLTREGADHSSFGFPDPDEEIREAEWGFNLALDADIEALAREKGYRLRRLSFATPEDLSPLVADLYRWWYRREGAPTDRLVVESFILHDPYWILRTRSVPWWAPFSVEPSLNALQSYLEDRDRFREAHLMLFSHGVESVGLAPVERWEEMIEERVEDVRLMGVDRERHPRDFSAFVEYHARFLEQIAARYPLPPRLTLGELEEFLQEHQGRHGVTIDN